MIPPSLLAYFFMALTVSFACSLLEAMLLSVRATHVEMLIHQGRTSGRILKSLRDRMDRPLIAILTLNTVANMLGAAGVGAEAQKWAVARDWSEPQLVAIASFVLTLAILICSEIIPKTVGAAYWKPLASPGAYVLRMLVFLLTPVIWVLEAIPSLITRKAGGVATVTREEIAVLAELGRQGGTIPGRESQVIANLFALSSVKAKDILTPRVEVFALQKDRSAIEVIESHKRIRFSRIPIYGDDTDDIKGIVHRHRLYEACVKEGGAQTLEALSSPVHFVPETTPISKLLDEFIKRNDHLFMVVDEFGSMEGIVTLEDVIETLLGVEIVDELDTVEDLRQHARLKMEERKRRLGMIEE